MFLKLSRQLLNKNAMIIFVFLQLSIIFLIGLLTSIWTLHEAAWGILELSLTFWTMVVFILINQKIYSSNIIERLELNSLSRYRLQLYIFIYVFVFGFVVILSGMLWSWVFSNFEDNYNVFHVDFFTLIDWSRIRYGDFFLIITGELLLIMGFVFFVNAVFNKRTSYLLMVTVFTFVYMIRFGNIWENYLIFREFDGVLYPIWKSEKSKEILIAHSVFVPWSTLGVWGANLYRYSGAEYAMDFFNKTHINTRGNLGLYLENSNWIPLLWIPLYLAVGSLINFLRKSERA